jgi:uncharacterized membrane protein
MKRLLLALPAIALAAGCATSQRPYAPVRDVAYQALGWNPMWLLAVGDDRIVLRQAGAHERAWPRVLPRTVDGVRIWQSGTGADRITITARPGPCQSGGAGQAGSRHVYNYEHHVALSVADQGLELRGCGGRILERVERR